MIRAIGAFFQGERFEMSKTMSAIALSLAFLLAATASFANARQHFLAGQNYYTQGRYEKAIEEFEEAYRLDPRPLLLFNISQAWEKMGDFEKSLDFLKRYLEAEPDNEDRATLLSKAANLEARIAATGIKVTCNEAEATVFVGGKEVGKTPFATVIPLKVGAHKVQISKKGFQDYTMNVAISSGQTTPVDATLEPGQSGPPPPVAPVTGDEDKDKDGEEPAGQEGGVEALDVVPWVIAGVGAAAAIVGLGVVGGMAIGNNDHDQAVIADIIGWPGVALAVGGTIWGVIRLTSKESDGEPGAETASASAMLVPVFDGKTAGLGAVVAF
jgi:hypothetical protein